MKRKIEFCYLMHYILYIIKTSCKMVRGWSIDAYDNSECEMSCHYRKRFDYKRDDVSFLFRKYDGPRHSDMAGRAKKSWCKERRRERESKYPY